MHQISALSFSRAGRRVRGLGCAIALLAATAAHALPSFDEVRGQWRSSEVRILDRDGALLQRLRTDASVRRGDWNALADISPALRTAMVMSEDRRFYEHSGVDWRAVSAAAWANLWNRRTRGASTITMQLAGLLDEDLRRGGNRGMAQKLGQAFTAEQLEKGWRKDQILEAYLNLVPFRGEIVGIDALSRSLFGKAPQGLDARESALAAALVRAPNAGRAAVARRACELLRRMEPQPLSDCTALDMFAEGALRRRAYPAEEGIAPHLARQLLRQAPEQARAGAVLRSTVSAPLQRLATATLQSQLRELHGRHAEDGAVVVLDNRSGEVLAWVGSSGALSQAPEVDGVLAQRQPGSTLKPFLYGEAIAERRLTAASLVIDSPEQIPTAGGLYVPQNYDRRFKGAVSVRTALAASLNVPAVRTLVMVGPEGFFQQLRRAGLDLRESAGYYGYSLALGSAEISLLQLANAYRMLANGGMAAPVRLRADQPAPASARALDAGAAFIVGDMLSDPDARSRTFGSDSVLATRFWTAVKTGTSKDMRDNWAMGWSQRYTVAVWVGNASGAAMWDVSGVSGAAPVWAAVMGWLHRREPSRPPLPPEGVRQQAVRFGAGLEAPRTEWFLAGTEQALFEPADGPGRATGPMASARILEPAPCTIVALDPDIPPRHQRLRLAADTGGASAAGLQWRIDGKPAGQGARLDWMPWPGRHRIVLADRQGVEQDSTWIEVRGAGLRR
ncbi:penicillin-binding protein 1C [Xylophilus rhododendri]|uniref:peptidoglycan glycosyltransferase n=1 Tax=Xylophilus rhododendri TaxID=2697032 RepID=A0A857JDP8_9BURK|nr:penicillin-binding protein 1C [Xylophilus rhododendri]QHJ00796.1 penicillin-binding protein 1C [Xylophilus rhododendri]